MRGGRRGLGEADNVAKMYCTENIDPQSCVVVFEEFTTFQWLFVEFYDK